MGIIGNSDFCVLNTYNRYPIVFIRGNGIFLYSDEGYKYLDMASGIAVTTLGHFNPRVASAIENQAKRLLHTSNLYYTEQYTNLAVKLINYTIFDKVFFCNSGAEANEAAIKLARKHGKLSGTPGKYEIITMKNSFHGRTLATITATGQEKYRKYFDPLVPGFKYVEINNKKEFEEAISEKTAAVFIELIQGEGGIRPVEKTFIKHVSKLCNENNTLLVFDEVQTGVGRTGRLFAYEYYSPYEPDIITTAKGLAGGMPIGAMLVKDKYAHCLGPGEHASTFGGNPVCCAAANAVLEEISEKKLVTNAAKMGNYFFKKLKELKRKHKCIVDVRGLGLLLGIEVTMPVTEIINKLLENFILTVPASGNVIRFLPPLIVEKANIDEVIEVLDKIFCEYK